MLFPTVTFAIFFVIVLPAVWALEGSPRARKLLLVAAGWVFYAWWDWRFVALLAAVIATNAGYAGAMTALPRRRTPFLVLGVATDLAVLGCFKYLGFFTSTLHDVADRLGLPAPDPVVQTTLVVGLSFFTFEAVAYLVEIHRGITTPMPLLDLAAYLSFFPKLASGPITRASEFAPQLAAAPARRLVEASRAFWLIGRGLVKKLVVASFLAEAIADGVFAVPSQHSALEVLVGIYAYAVQIFVDFSAYTDMAIGLALLLGFHLPENFDAPYRATSVHDFWRRWHMTLSRWIRDFLFQPLVVRGSRTLAAVALTQVFVMLLVGLWHGAAWTFVAWGGFHGLALAVERAYREWARARGRRRRRHGSWGRVVATVVTFHFVAFSWVFFRADSLGTAFEVLGRLGSFGPAPAVTPLVVLVVAGALAVQYLPAGWSQKMLTGFSRLAPAVQAAALGGLLLVVDGLGPSGVPPFIYFRF